MMARAFFLVSEGRARNAMRTEGPDGGSSAPAALLALLLVILVGATVYIFAARLFLPPPPISRPAVMVDRQYDRTLVVTGAAFVAAQLGLAWAVFRFRDRGQRAHFSRGSAPMEILWTCVTLAAFLGLGILGNRVWGAIQFAPTEPGAIEIEGTASQFVYVFRYPGPDEKFGRLDPQLVSPATGNPLGLDPNDPAGTDDIVVPELTVPVDHPIELLIRSQDVVHNFFIRELRLQQDAVPGMMIPMRFTANRVGRYDVVCTQLCGLGHYRMHSFLNVVSEADYESFLKTQAAAQ
jgi:cytochrome c oxidase subunit II